MSNTKITIKWKHFFKDPSVYFDCFNYNIVDKGDSYILSFDQKTIFGKVPRHREVYIMKHAIFCISIRDTIKEIKYIEQ